MLKQDFFKDLLIDLKYEGKNIKGLSISTAKDIHEKTVGLIVTKNFKSLLVNINNNVVTIHELGTKNTKETNWNKGFIDNIVPVTVDNILSEVEKCD